MKCSNCGAELEDGVAFCTSCGTPTAQKPNDDSDRTVLVSQENVNSGQPQGFPSAAQPGMQTGFGQPQPTQPSFGQTGTQTGFGQPQPAQPNYGQPGAQTGFGQPQPAQPNYGQPGMQTGFGQPQPAQPNYGQTGMQTGFGQPQPMQPNYGQPGMQTGYGQPGMYNQAPRPPKPPRKPLSSKAKAGIIGGAIGVVVLIVFFAVILPILLRAKLDGEYTYTDSWDDAYTAIFDDGTYVVYDYEDDVYSAGTYTIKDDKVTLTDIEGYETSAKFDAKDNKIRIDGDTYKSTDKKATIGFKLTADYYDNLKSRFDTAINKVLADEDIYDDVYWSSAYVYDDDLSDPGTDFERALATEIGYSDDIILQTLMEGGYIEVDVYITYDGDIEISYYVW